MYFSCLQEDCYFCVDFSLVGVIYSCYVVNIEEKRRKEIKETWYSGWDKDNESIVLFFILQKRLWVLARWTNIDSMWIYCSVQTIADNLAAKHDDQVKSQLWPWSHNGNCVVDAVKTQEKCAMEQGTDLCSLARVF